MSTCSTIDDTRIAQARASAYALIAHAFRCPDEAWLDLLGEPGRWEGWPEALATIDDEIGGRLSDLQESVVGQSRSCDPRVPRGSDDKLCGGERVRVSLAEIQESFNVLFGHAVRGKCPPYELEYGRSEIIQQASNLADVAGFYSAFGMEIAEDACDRVDHLCSECEFMSVLCAKEAEAIDSSETEHTEIVRLAQRHFLRDHLVTWVPALSYRIDEAEDGGFYGLVAGFLTAFISSEASRFHIGLGPTTLELRPVDEVQDTSISCGGGGCGPGGGSDELVQVNVAGEQSE